MLTVSPTPSPPPAPPAPVPDEIEAAGIVDEAGIDFVTAEDVDDANAVTVILSAEEAAAMAVAEPQPVAEPEPETKSPPAAEPATPLWFRPLSDHLLHAFQSQEMTDVEWVCQDGKIGSHQFVLAHVSPLLRHAFRRGGHSLSAGDTTTPTVILAPDFHTDDVKALIESLYLGSGSFEGGEAWQKVERMSLELRMNVGFGEDGVDVDMGSEDDDDDDEEEDKDDTDTDDEGKEEKEEEETSEDDDEEDDDDGEKNVKVLRKAGLQVSKVPAGVAGPACHFCKKPKAMHRRQIVSSDPSSPDGQQVRTVYKCCRSDCSVVNLASEAEHRDHMRRHSRAQEFDDGVVSCPVCEKWREPHYVAGCGVLRCCQPDCGFETARSYGFLLHVETHAGESSCSWCSEKFSGSLALQRHVQQRHADQAARHRCNICGFKSASKQGLGVHIKAKHGDGVLSLESESAADSPASSPTQSVSIRPVKRDSLTSLVPCLVCGNRFTSAQLAVHRKTCRDKPVKKGRGRALSAPKARLQCEFCGQKGFVSQLTFREHVRARHGGGKPYSCSLCWAKFATPTQLSEHRSFTHGLQPTKPVPVVGSTLSASAMSTDDDDEFDDDEDEEEVSEDEDDWEKDGEDDWEKDGAVHVPSASKKTAATPQRRWPCSVCGRVFPTKAAWSVHARAHAQEKGPAEDGEVVVKRKRGRPRKVPLPEARDDDDGDEEGPGEICDQCSRKFPSKSSLADHVAKMHSGDDVKVEEDSDEEDVVFACDQCGKTFKTKPTLTRHKRLCEPVEVKEEPEEDEEEEDSAKENVAKPDEDKDKEEAETRPDEDDNGTGAKEGAAKRPREEEKDEVAAPAPKKRGRPPKNPKK